MDLSVVGRAASGDEEAVRTVLEGCREKALTVARGFTGDRDEAEDLAQEILLKVYRALPSLKEAERFGSWFFTLAHRVCLGWKRSRKRRDLHLGELWLRDEREDPSVAPDPFCDPEEAVLVAEQRGSIRHAIQAVGRESRKALAEGARSLASVLQAVGTEDARTPVAELVEAGYVAKEGDRLRLSIPVFTEAEDRLLLPVVDGVCREMVARSRIPGLKNLDGLLDEMGFQRLRTQYPAMHAYVSSEISGFCLESLVERGLLGTPPEKAPAAWACWAWKGAVKVTNWR